MPDTVIRVENLSKRYFLNHVAKTHAGQGQHLSERLQQTLTAPLQWFNRKSRLARKDNIAQKEEFWALKDVSFEVKQGDVIGIIGRNGAGKSTLLKILSRITEPTGGEVKIKGRVASLLEVGTGFHPELTGRENIFLNGSILGMKRSEIRTKFDEIVDFAEVERFLDTQVKHYSSGMYVRLAFAVAAHLDPEILIVDEVLAVGDAAFQKKCLGKMNAVATQQGRTILFVTHNMGMITALCSKAILLQGGTLTNTGSAASIVVQYYGANAGHSPARCEFTDGARRPGDKYARLVSCSVVDPRGDPASEHDIQSPMEVRIIYQIISSPPPGITYPQVNLYAATGEMVFQSLAPSRAKQHDAPGLYAATCTIPSNFLNNDTFHVGVALATAGNAITIHFHEKNVLTFTVKEDLQVTLESGRNGYGGPIAGPVRPLLNWSIERSSVT